MIYVQHLPGIGHLQHASLPCSTLQRNNPDIDLVTGGVAVSTPDHVAAMPLRTIDIKMHGAVGSAQLLNEWLDAK